MFYLNLTHPEIQKIFAGLYEIAETTQEDGSIVTKINLQKEKIKSFFEQWNQKVGLVIWRRCKGRSRDRRTAVVVVEYILQDIVENFTPDWLELQQIIILILSLLQQAQMLQKLGQNLAPELLDDIHEISNYRVDLRALIAKEYADEIFAEYFSIAMMHRIICDSYCSPKMLIAVYTKLVFGFSKLVEEILFAAEQASEGKFEENPLLISASAKELFTLMAPVVLGDSLYVGDLNIWLLIQMRLNLEQSLAKSLDSNRSDLVISRSRHIWIQWLDCIIAVCGVSLIVAAGLIPLPLIVIGLMFSIGFIATILSIFKPFSRFAWRQQEKKSANANKIIISSAAEDRALLQKKTCPDLKILDLRVPGEVVVEPVEDLTDPIVSTSNYRAEPPHATNTLVRSKRLEFKTNMRPPSQLPRQLLWRSLPSAAKTMLYLQGVFRSLGLANWIGTFDSSLRRFRSVTLFSAQQKIAHLNNSDKSLSAEEKAFLDPNEQMVLKRHRRLDRFKSI